MLVFREKILYTAYLMHYNFDKIFYEIDNENIENPTTRESLLIPYKFLFYYLQSREWHYK